MSGIIIDILIYCRVLCYSMYNKSKFFHFSWLMLFTPEKKQKTSVLYLITSLPKEEKCAVCFDLDIVFINGELAILPVKRVQCPTISFA